MHMPSLDPAQLPTASWWPEYVWEMYADIQTIQAASEDSEYVICVDDDVALHPSTVSESVAALERDQSAFMLTGISDHSCCPMTSDQRFLPTLYLRFVLSWQI